MRSGKGRGPDRKAIEAVVTGLIGAVAVIFSVVALFQDKPTRPPQSVDLLKYTENEVKRLEGEIEKLKSGLSVGDHQRVDVDVAELEAEISSVAAHVAELREIILDTPEKALAVPLLRKDVATLEERVTALSLSTAEQIQQLYGFAQWFFGAVITVGLALITKGVWGAAQGRTADPTPGGTLTPTPSGHSRDGS